MIATSLRQPASLRRRLASLLYETLLLAALWVAAGFALLPFISASAAGRATDLTVLALPERLLSFGYYFTIAALYFTWSWSAGRRTLAMKTWRLVLMQAVGGPLPYKRAMVRYCVAWFGPLAGAAAYAGMGRWGWALVATNYAWAALDPERQFLHDRVAGTRLYHELATPVAA